MTEKLLHIRALLLLIITAILWSFGGILIKIINWNAFAIAGMRSFFALPLMLYLFRKHRFCWSFSQIAGAVFYAGTVILFVLANKLTTAANAILLQFTAPVYVALLSGLILKEKIHWYDWLAVFMVIFGLFLFFFDKITASGIRGNIIALISGLCFALTLIFMRMQKKKNPLGSLILGNITTIIICIPFMFHNIPGFQSWIGLVLMGVFQLGLSYSLYAYAVKHVTAIEGVLVPVIEPILNPIWVFFFAGEVPGVWAVFGGCMIIIFVVLRSVLALKEKTYKIHVR